jgi:hypothetical protein
MDDNDDVIVVDYNGAPKAVSVFDLVNPARPRADKETRTARMSICKSCDRYSNYRCSECGCFMKTKTILADAMCPIGKWHNVPPTP